MRKKLFAILMSAMMMVTFMPSMAFAADFGEEAKLTQAQAEAKAVDAYFALNPHELGLSKGDALEYNATGATTVCEKMPYGNNWINNNYYSVVLEKAHSNSNMKAGKKIHLACGQDVQIYECQTKYCGFKTFAYNVNSKKLNAAGEVDATKHPDATNEEMSLEAFVQKYLKEQADALLAQVNIADTLVDGAVVVTGGTIRTAEAFMAAADKAATDAANFFVKMMTPGLGEAISFNVVKEAFQKFFYSISPWGIAENISTAAGTTAALMTGMAQAIAYGTITATTAIVDALEVAAEVYYGNEDKGIYGLQNICKLIVTTCPDCGILDAQIVAHKNSKGACASNFVCDNCNKKIWVTKNLFNASHAKIKVVNTNKELPAGEGDLVLPAGKLDVEKLDCATTISYKCADCGESMISLPIRKQDGHDLQTTTLLKATTLTKGIEADKCSKCGLITNVRLTDKVQHTHDKSIETVVEATCSMPGYTVLSCSGCGQFMGLKKGSVVAPKKHVYKTETLVEPTCESGGIFRIYCGNAGCNCEKVILGGAPGKLYDLSKFGKNYSNITKLATDTEAPRGRMTADLDNLSFELTDRIGEGVEGIEDLLDLLTKWSGYTKTDVFENGTGHIDFIKVMTAKSKTYNKEDAFDVVSGKGTGWKTTYYFTGFGYCGFTDAFEKVKDVSRVAVDHDFEINKKNLNELPSLKKAGKVTVGTDNYVQVAPATCTSPALWAVACDNCGMYDVHKLHNTAGVFEVGVKNGHKYETEEVAATCEHKAGKISVCSVCGDRVVTGLEEIKGGKCVPSGDWVTLKDSTFTKVGTRVQYCVNCEQICKYDDISVKKLAKAYQPTLKAGKKSFKATFKNVGKAASGVQVAYKVKGANNYKYKTTDKSSLTVKGLKSGKKYAVKVRKFVKEDGKTIYGKWCAVKYVTVK